MPVYKDHMYIKTTCISRPPVYKDWSLGWSLWQGFTTIRGLIIKMLLAYEFEESLYSDPSILRPPMGTQKRGFILQAVIK